MIGCLGIRRRLNGKRLGGLRIIEELGLEAFLELGHTEEDIGNDKDCADQKDPLLHCLDATKKRTAFCLAQRTSKDMDRALETLRTMLGRRGLETKTERIVTEDLDRVNLYTIGKILVVFSQKDKGLLEKDILTFRKYAEANDYTNGLIVVALVSPSDNVLKTVKRFAADRLQFFHIRQLQFDITTHRMAVPHRILKEDEKTAVYTAYTISKPEDQIPWIDSQDPMAKWVGAVPGDILEITRHSDVAGPTLYYRYCVADVNVA